MDMINNMNLFIDLNVQEWTYLIVGLTFSIYIGIAIWSRVKTTKEFYVAGAGVSPLANGMDRRLCLISIAFSSIFKEIRKIYCS